MPSWIASTRTRTGVAANTRAMLFAALPLLALTTSVHAEPLFIPPLSLGVGSSPASAAIADLNGDGRPDLVVANFGSNTVSVLLENAAGTFSGKTDFGTGGAPCSVAIADVNGDGRPDLVVANAVSNTVSVLLGNGDGTFATRTDFGTGINPCSVAIVDLNADSRPDLLVANLASNTVSVLLGTGGGAFAAKSDFRTGTNPSSLTIGDFNADGRPDVATVNQYALPLSVLLGIGDGTFAARQDYLFATRNPSSVASGDMNGDGRPDLVIAGGGFDEVSILLGSADGTFVPALDVGTGLSPASVVIADFNADGRLDLATANAGSNTVSVLLQNAGGTYDAEPELNTEEFPYAVAARDLDGDGRADLVVTNRLSNTISVFRTRPAPVVMAFRLKPRQLELDSRRRWVKGFLEPASPFAASDINIASIRLNDTVPVDPAARTSLADHDDNGIPDLMVRFKRAELERTLAPGDTVEVTVTGVVAGQRFLGTAHIRVRREEMSGPAAGSVLTAGTVTQLRWQPVIGVGVRAVDLFHSLDGGSTWNLIARGQPNTGRYAWRVPDVRSDQVRVALAIAGAALGGADHEDGSLVESGTFSIENSRSVSSQGQSGLALAIRGTTPSPATGGRLHVEFALHEAGPARLELLDVAGRALSSREVGALGAGVHTLDWEDGVPLRPGIYFLRLVQGTNEVRARATVLR